MTSTDCSPARSGSLQKEATGEIHLQRTRSPLARTLFNRHVAEGGPGRPQGLGVAPAAEPVICHGRDGTCHLSISEHSIFFLGLGSMATPVLGKSMARGKRSLSSISPGLVSVCAGYGSSTRPHPQASTSGLKSNLLVLESNLLPQFSLLP